MWKLALFLLFIAPCLGYFPSSQERNALDAFISNTNVMSVLSWSGNSTQACTNYTGVTCSSSAVIGLALPFSGITGVIPSNIKNLTSLIILDLSGNFLGSFIPIEITTLVNLTTLNLGNNQLNGSIPANISRLTNLSIFRVGSNNLNGTIPSSLGKMANLKNFTLQANQFSGALPNLTSITYCEARPGNQNLCICGVPVQKCGILTNCSSCPPMPRAPTTKSPTTSSPTTGSPTMRSPTMKGPSSTRQLTTEMLSFEPFLLESGGDQRSPFVVLWVSILLFLTVIGRI